MVGAPAACIAPHVEATPVGQGCGRQGYLDLGLEEKESHGPRDRFEISFFVEFATLTVF